MAQDAAPPVHAPVCSVCVEGIVERIVYENEDSGFLVGRLSPAGGGGQTTFVGNMVAISAGETVRLWGNWVDDKRFGRQLRIERYETVLPTSAEAIEKYLGSGLIHGVGPVYAKRLVQAFGVDTLRVIDEEPERLRKVPGIGQNKAKRIRESWEKQKALQSIMLFLQGHGIGLRQAVRIYKRYGDGAATLLRENPYRLAEDISGIGFHTADKIAAMLGMPNDSPKRMQAGLRFVLEEAVSNGHVFLPEAELIESAADLLELPADGLPGPLDTLCERGLAVRDVNGVYLARLRDAEVVCARRLKDISAARGEHVPIKIENAIAWVETRGGIVLSPEQREAVRIAAEAKVLVITGGPGTGKTTLLKGILDIFEKKDVAVRLTAPTGRAARRLSETTGRDARTIHRLLEYSPAQGAFQRNETNPLNCGLLIVDETSMVDVELMAHLLRALPRETRLILVGDVDQLPSVGPGNVLLDVISSGTVPVVWLKTVFRQADQSGIVANAHRINKGEHPRFNSDDFFYVERREPEQALAAVVEIVSQRLPRAFGLDAMRDVQVLAPMHRGDAGVTRLNEALQEALNPAGAPLPRRNLRLGDKVMQLRNNYELDVFNGDIGIVDALDEEAKNVGVQYDDRGVLYGFDELDELALAYATTVHKSQGSEYPAVVIPLLRQQYMMLQRNILYTAITRARRLVVLVGDPRAIGRAVRNTEVVRRYTCLAERLRNLSGSKPAAPQGSRPIT